MSTHESISFKQSYYVDHERNEVILNVVDERVKGRFDEVIVYSFDSQTGKGLLDFLPQSATKQTALEYIAEELGIDKLEVVFCGDSGNDVFPLTAGFPASSCEMRTTSSLPVSSR
jgi:hydroxymethylpyrimidine pyrophosphatase-like HAD family hydrolase